MLKRISGVTLIAICVLLLATKICAAPLDLSSFSQDPGVTVSGNSAEFVEDFEFSAWYLENNFFFVPEDASILSFNYDFELGEYDWEDYFVFEVDYTPILEVFETTTYGYFQYDLTLYRSDLIDLAWGLIWGGDEEAGSIARIYNVDLQRELTPAPVPEPATLLLLGTGLVGLLAAKRKRQKNR